VKQISQPAGAVIGSVHRRTLLAGGLALAATAGGLVGCSPAADSASPAADADGATPTTAATESELGSTLTAIIEPLMSELMVPGVVVAVHTPKETWRHAFGRRALAADAEPVTVDDHFRIGSNTKTMTGTCVLQLVDEGIVALENPVQKHLPELTDAKLRGVTVAQLLDMRSGLRSYTVLRSFNQILDSDPGRAWQPEELVALGLAEKVDFPPGTDWTYSNTNTVLAGMIVERHDQRLLEESFRARIIDKLALNSTLLPAKDSAAIPQPHPRGYMYGTNVSTLEDAELSAADQQRARSGELEPGDYTDTNPSWGWAAGAAISTAADLTTYVEALIGGGLVSPELQRRRLDSIVPVGSAGAGYGLALASFGPMLGHDGSLPGFTSFMAHDPKSSTTLIVLTTLQSSPDGKMVANEIARPLIGAIIPS
jgi:D-alanyl-D-alanine carboxypeptidase